MLFIGVLSKDDLSYIAVMEAIVKILEQWSWLLVVEVHADCTLVRSQIEKTSSDWYNCEDMRHS